MAAIYTIHIPNAPSLLMVFYWKSLYISYVSKNEGKNTIVAEPVARINFWINTQQVGKIWSLHEALI